MNVQLKYEQVPHVLHILLCAAIFSYQIVTICQIYFSYKTTNFVKYENISKISLPAITICMDKREVITNEAKERYNLSKVTDEILSKFTVEEQFSMLMEYRSIFRSCSVKSPILFKGLSSFYKSCNKITSVVVSIDYTRSNSIFFL